MKTIDKRNKILKVLAISLFVFLIVGLFVGNCSFVSADVGNNNRYESSSSSSGSSDSGFISLIIYLLFELFGPIPGLILIAIGVIVFFVLKKNGKLDNIKDKINDAGNSFNSGINNLGSNLSNGLNDVENSFSNNNNINNSSQVAESVRQVDPAFSQDAFIGWVREVFVKIQQAWSTREWKVIRPFESNELFSQHSAQLQEYIDNNKINKIEKININYCELREFKVDGDKEVMVVELHAIMRDYVVDATTNKVLESNPNKDWHMKYLMTFNRKTGVQTRPGTSNKSTTNCPNCGAVTNITSSGQCNYCDSVITTGEHDWVLSDIKSIK